MDIATWYEKTRTAVSDVGQQWALFCFGVHLSVAEERCSSRDSGIAAEVVGILKTFETEFKLTRCGFLSDFALFPCRTDFTVSGANLPSEELIRGFYRFIFAGTLPGTPASADLWEEIATATVPKMNSYDACVKTFSVLSTGKPDLEILLKKIVVTGHPAPVYCIGPQRLRTLRNAFVVQKVQKDSADVCFQLVRCGYELARQSVCIRPDQAYSVKKALLTLIQTARRVIESPSAETKAEFLSSVSSVLLFAESTYTFTRVGSYRPDDLPMAFVSKFGIAQTIDDDSCFRLGPVIDHELAVFDWHVSRKLFPDEANSAPYSLISVLYYIAKDPVLSSTDLGKDVVDAESVWGRYVEDLKVPSATKVRFNSGLDASIQFLSYALCSKAWSPAVVPAFSRALRTLSGESIPPKQASGTFFDYTKEIVERPPRRALSEPPRLGSVDPGGRLDTGGLAELLEAAGEAAGKAAGEAAATIQDDPEFLMFGVIIPILIFFGHKIPKNIVTSLFLVIVATGLYCAGTGVQQILSAVKTSINGIDGRHARSLYVTGPEKVTEGVNGSVQYNFYGPFTSAMTGLIFGMIFSVSNWKFINRRELAAPSGSSTATMIPGLSVKNAKKVLAQTSQMLGKLGVDAAKERAASSRPNEMANAAAVGLSAAGGPEAAASSTTLLYGPLAGLAAGTAVGGIQYYVSGWFQGMKYALDAKKFAETNYDYLEDDVNQGVLVENAVFAAGEFVKALPFFGEKLLYALESTGLISGETSLRFRSSLLYVSRTLPLLTIALGAFRMYTGELSLTAVVQVFTADRDMASGVSVKNALKKLNSTRGFSYFDPNFGSQNYTPEGELPIWKITESVMSLGLVGFFYYVIQKFAPLSDLNVAEMTSETSAAEMRAIRIKFGKKLVQVATRGTSPESDSDIGLMRAFFREIFSKSKFSTVAVKMLSIEEKIFNELLAIYDFSSVTDILLQKTTCLEHVLNADTMVYVFNVSDLVLQDDSITSVKRKAAESPFSVQLNLFPMNGHGERKPNLYNAYVYKMLYLFDLQVPYLKRKTEADVISKVNKGFKTTKPDNIPPGGSQSVQANLKIILGSWRFIQTDLVKIGAIGPSKSKTIDVVNAMVVNDNIADKTLFKRQFSLPSKIARVVQFMVLLAARYVRVKKAGGTFFGPIKRVFAGPGPRPGLVKIGDSDQIGVDSAVSTVKTGDLTAYVVLITLSEISGWGAAKFAA